MELSKLSAKIGEKSGKPPGTTHYVGKEKRERVKIELMDYTKDYIKELKTYKIEDVYKYVPKRSTTWINMTGVHEIDKIEKLGKQFLLHPLLIEDVADTNQRPKIEEYPNELFLVIKMIDFDIKKNEIKNENVSIVLGKNFLISFLEDPGDVFEDVRKRIREGNQKLREGCCDYLLYSLLDAIIDNYFVVLEKLGEKIEIYEELVIKNPEPSVLNRIYKVKREMIILRKSIWPLREVINHLLRDDSKFIKKDTQAYFRDIYDHTIRIMDTIDTFRDMLSGMLDLYASTVSNKMNEIMKVLTIISTIFIPLTFLAGVYGMNFRHMPELDLVWFYPSLLLCMFTIAMGMIYYFKKKKWIGKFN